MMGGVVFTKHDFTYYLFNLNIPLVLRSWTSIIIIIISRIEESLKCSSRHIQVVS